MTSTELASKSLQMNALTRALIIGVAAVLCTAACSQKKSPAPAAGGAAGIKAGTSDSGGGTGVEGKVFERFIVDPMTLPEYVEHLAPRFANLKDEKGDQSLALIMKLKTWYVGPFDLDTLDKDSLGVSFLKNTLTQVARQSLRSVWVDDRVYNAKGSTTYDKAVLLAHEWVMAMYMMKFMTYAEFCKAAAATPGGGCGGDTAEVDRAFPPTPPRKLDENDNENIRFVTDWFLRNTLNRPIASDDFVRIMIAHGFDKRFFSPGDDPADSKPASLPVKRAELLATLRGSTLTGTMPDVCTGAESGKSSACKLEFADAKNAMAVSLTLPGQKPLDFETYLWDETELSVSSDLGVKDLFTITFFNRSAKVRIGDRAYSLVLIFSKSTSPGQIELRSAVLRTGVIVSIDKKRDPVCFARAPRVQSLLDDGLIIRREGVAELGLERYYAGLPPLTTCSDVNVD